MKKGVSWCAILILIAVAYSGTAQVQAKPVKAAPAKATTIPWRTSYNQALQEAKRTHKPLMVFFHASWCTYCKVMDDKTFPTASVVTAAKKWMPVRLDEDQNQPISKKYQVNGDLPTVLFLKSTGVLAGRSKGYQTSTTLTKAMNLAYAKAR